MTSNLNRRRWLELGTALMCGTLIDMGLSKVNLTHSTPKLPSKRARAVNPTMALSLKELQSRIRMHRGHSLDHELASLGGMTQILGFTIDAMDVILLGSNTGGAAINPQIHVDDLAVALQSAYRVRLTESGAWEPIGVSIDPRPTAEDPWAIQDLRILGQPRARMAKRQWLLDAELKAVGASLKRLPGVTGAFDETDATENCAASQSATSEVTSRFWFCSSYPQHSPRFEVESQAAYVVDPVNVCVMTEVTKVGGGRVGDSDPTSERFAQQVTKLIQSATRPEYESLVADFRIIEIAELMRYLRVSSSLVRELLDYTPEVLHDIPYYVAGIRRTDTSEVACDGKITVTEQGIEANTPLYRRTVKYRGGVEARVIVRPESTTQASAQVQREVFHRAIDARPHKAALAWFV